MYLIYESRLSTKKVHQPKHDKFISGDPQRNRNGENATTEL